MKFFAPLRKRIIIVAVALVMVLSAGFVVTADRDFDILKNLDIYFSLFRELNMFYVDDTNPEKLVNKSIDAMLSSLDPYTQYIPESQAEEFRFQTTGEYGGIGALIRKTPDAVLIAEPYENSPAVKNGLRAGDMLVEIDGKPVKNQMITDVSEMLKGSPGTQIELTVKRPFVDKLFKKSITREKIVIPNVPYYGLLTKDIGYIRLSSFTPNAGKEVGEALQVLKEKMGAKSIILDLRGNPGGLLIEAVNVVGTFVDKGREVVSTRGKIKEFDNVYKTVDDPVDTTIPLVLLVNRSSASASEIVAGAIQDLDRGVIVGQRTFGKGLVQTTRRLSYNAQLKVTTAKYYIPSGRCIQALDYSHRNPDGSVGYIPDSLIRAFKTRNGRIVFDGGGVQPDLHVDAEMLSNLSISLYAKNLIFDYATLYAAHHDTISAPAKFSLSDTEYSDFVKYLQGKDFDYETESETKLDDLVKSAKKEKYYAFSEPEFKALKQKLAHDKFKDLQSFSDEIKSLLGEEIVSRYYYQKGRIQFSLVSDEQLKKAIALLEDHSRYRSILNGSWKEDTHEARGISGQNPD